MSTSTSPPEEPPIDHTLTTPELHTLATLAIHAKRQAYCPYSNFRVGASLLTDPINDQCYFHGSNVEVASTPVGICAERCALAPIVARMERPGMPRVRALAVSTDIWPPGSPCGMCRQMIREFCDQDMKVYMYGRKPISDSTQTHTHKYTPTMDAAEELKICGDPVVMTLGELLPMSFGPGDLKRGGQ